MTFHSFWIKFSLLTLLSKFLRFGLRNGCAAAWRPIFILNNNIMHAVSLLLNEFNSISVNKLIFIIKLAKHKGGSACKIYSKIIQAFLLTTLNQTRNSSTVWKIISLYSILGRVFLFWWRIIIGIRV